MGELEQESNEGSTVCDRPWWDRKKVLLGRITVIALFVFSLVICGILAVAALVLPGT
jgi:hypothetical protein